MNAVKMSRAIINLFYSLNPPGHVGELIAFSSSPSEGTIMQFIFRLNPHLPRTNCVESYSLKHLIGLERTFELWATSVLKDVSFVFLVMILFFF